ncbi:cobyrinate a,c-diamide synthase [Nocardioides nematodiphilus]|uniref:cobyrinate a,c-diamide synthase n=1 Tax=Nocardioides nematodiphilus TaxID=2849669 RepID=UPI001CDA1E9E|nr:cobyrinate a,c-diamide synthase [Nocardioides nematodiphilus]MCA1983844.1 cobyrinate a,c-diamide synthase [Nocardioides nematodiphilus]
MVTRLPRLVIAAPSTGQGKTTVATGLMAALRADGLAVSGHKIGPDYIDPGYHALATGRPGRNLDPHLVGEERITPLLLHGARDADIAIIEGVMGLHDGRIGTDGFSSTAHVARLTRTPVVLVLDIGRMSRSAGAIVAGVAAYDPSIEVVGVILNQAGSARNVEEVRRSIRGLPVLGVIPRDPHLATPSRHLGLVPAAEREQSAATIERLGAQVAQHVDLDAIKALAQRAPALGSASWEPTDHVRPPARAGEHRSVVAVAGGRAFTFRYAETEELLVAAGCEVVAFDPLVDAALPAGVQGIYLGGGFPEVYAAELASNRALLADLRAAVAAGVPTVAECAGLLYLARSLDGVPMAGVLPIEAAMSSLTLRYPVARSVGDTLLTRAGEQVSGHEFHKTQTSAATDTDGSPAWEIDGERVGFATPTLHASYLHTHWAGAPQLAQRFADAVHAAAPHRRVPFAPEATAPTDAFRDPLRHHGDTETGEAMLDFAVNVFDGPRPAWLERVLHEAIDASASYPDALLAARAIAQRYGRRLDEVLPTAGAAEAFTLIARSRDWQLPVVVHPQFTEPQVALEQAGHKVTEVLCRPEAGFAIEPAAVPDEADLVVIGNPTNPTGVLHPRETITALLRPGRVVLVDEAFMDVVAGETASLLRERHRGLVVVRSLTKHWSIPGIRAGYVVGDPQVVAGLRAQQTPWSVSGPAIAATVACLRGQAADEARSRTDAIVRWRAELTRGLDARGIEHIRSQASFVLARLGAGTRERLRSHGIAVRRADTFPGLDDTWARIAVRPPDRTRRLLTALDAVAPTGATR